MGFKVLGIFNSLIPVKYGFASPTSRMKSVDTLNAFGEREGGHVPSLSPDVLLYLSHSLIPTKGFAILKHPENHRQN